MRIPNLAISASFPAHVAFRTHIKAKSVELPWGNPPLTIWGPSAPMDEIYWENPPASAAVER